LLAFRVAGLLSVGSSVGGPDVAGRERHLFECQGPAVSESAEEPSCRNGEPQSFWNHHLRQTEAKAVLEKITTWVNAMDGKL
jgi:hypothetical protein